MNEKKTTFMTPKNHKRVLGITINDNMLKVPKDIKRTIRAMLHYEVSVGDYVMNDKIRGYIAYINSIEKNYKEKCMNYLIRLSQSTLCLFPEIVKAYNEHKIFKELPDMKEKQPTDFVKIEDAEDFSNMVYYEHWEYLIAHGLVDVDENEEQTDLEELFE